MPVIDRGRVVAPLRNKLFPKGTFVRGLKASTYIDGKYVCMETYSKEKTRGTGVDLTIVRERFGVNTSQALSLSLHLVAEAIRAGRFAV